MLKMMNQVNIHLEDKTKSRKFFVFLWLLYALVYMTKNCFNGAMAIMVAEGVLTKSQNGFLTSMFYLVYAPLQVVGGVLADKYSPHKLITFSLLGAAVCNLTIFFCHSYRIMLIVWIVNAAVQTPLWPSVFKIESSQLFRSDRKQMIFFMSFTSSFGLALAYVSASLMPAWQYNFLFSAMVLLLLAVLLPFACAKLDKSMLPDMNDDDTSDIPPEEQRKFDPLTPAWKLFAVSGFFILLPAVLLRCMVEQGAKTLSPTMLMEMYDRISPVIGNRLNLFIIFSGILGTLLIKFVLYPRLIKNEAFGIFLMLIAAIPCAAVIKMVGTVSVLTIVLALCGITTTLTATHILLSYFCLYFVPYGKNGVAAGVGNAAASFGIVLASYGFVKIAEKYSWNTLATIWIVMLGIACVLTGLAVPFFERFKKNVQKEK